MQRRADPDARLDQDRPDADLHDGAPPRSIRLIVPADAEQVSILRAVAAGAAAKAGLSVDAIADLRIAVTEAAGRLLGVGPTRELGLEIEPEEGSVTAAVSVGVVGPQAGGWPGPGVARSVGWALIDGLCEEASDEVRDGRPTTVLTLGSRPKR